MIKINKELLKAIINNPKYLMDESEGNPHETYGNCWYYKSGTKVHLHIGINSLPDSTKEKKIYTMPEGYRPSCVICGRGISAVVTGNSNVMIWPSGTVNFYSTDGYAIVDVEYDAFN